MVMNRRPGLRQAHEEALQKYDGLIIPTIPSVARKQPSAEDLDVLGFIKESVLSVCQHGCSQSDRSPGDITECRDDTS